MFDVYDINRDSSIDRKEIDTILRVIIFLLPLNYVFINSINFLLICKGYFKNEQKKACWRPNNRDKN